MSDASSSAGAGCSSPPKPAASPNFLMIGCLAAIVSGIVSGVISTGICLVAIFVVLPSGGSISPPTDTIAEEGAVEVRIVGLTQKGETQVFYRQPFAAPPRLTLVEANGCFLLEQKADSFKVACDYTGQGLYQNVSTAKWKAEGIPAP